MRKPDICLADLSSAASSCRANITTAMKKIMGFFHAVGKRLSSIRGILNIGIIGIIIVAANFGLLLIKPDYSLFVHENAGQKSSQSQFSVSSDAQDHSQGLSSSNSTTNVSVPRNLYQRPPFYDYREFVNPKKFDQLPQSAGKAMLANNHAPFNNHYGFLRQNLTLMRERTLKRPKGKVRVAFDFSLKKSFFQLYRHLQTSADDPFCPRQPECEFYFTSSFDDGEVAMNADALVTDQTKGILVNNATLHFNKYVVLPDQHQSLYHYDWSGTDIYAGHLNMTSKGQNRSAPRSYSLSSIDEEHGQFCSMALHSQKLPIVTFVIPEAICHTDPDRPSSQDIFNQFLNAFVKEAQNTWSMPVYIIPPRKCQLPSSITLSSTPSNLQRAIEAKCPLHEPPPVIPRNDIERDLYKILPTNDHIRCSLAISRGAVVVEPVPEPNLFSQHAWSALTYGAYLAFIGDANSFVEVSQEASKGVLAIQSSSYDADPKAVAADVAKRLAEVVMGKVQPGSTGETDQDNWLKSVGYQVPPAARPSLNNTDGDPLANLMDWKRRPLLHKRFFEEVYNSRVNFPCRVCHQIKVKKTSVRCLLDLLDKHQTKNYDVSMNDIVVPGDNINAVSSNTNNSSTDSPPNKSTGPSGPGPWSEIFDRIYLLHYSRIPQRLTYMRNLLTDANIEAHVIRDFDRENVPGALHTCLDNWFTSEVDQTRNQGWPILDGETSLALKHFQAFNRMIHQDLADVLILEDDCEWGEYATPEQVADAFRLIPRNYGIVMLGTFPTQKQGGGEVRTVETRLASRSTLAYAISKLGVILNFRNLPFRMPIDMMMIDVEASETDVGGIKHPDWRTFWITPAVFNHNAEMNKGNLTGVR
ncbi:hypothetical protein HDU76_012821 [Blyttiomyces sp. JEL0837]|nr:hypothetical protein HDU76_012821 [Blyttiomyces sp. JEL0837]